MIFLSEEQAIAALRERFKSVGTTYEQGMEYLLDRIPTVRKEEYPNNINGLAFLYFDLTYNILPSVRVEQVTMKLKRFVHDYERSRGCVDVEDFSAEVLSLLAIISNEGRKKGIQGK